MDENKWEYNYSSSDNTAGGTGYPNVGSSGMNTANQYNNEPEPQAAAPDAGSTVPPTEVPPQQPAAPEPPKRKSTMSMAARWHAVPWHWCWPQSWALQAAMSAPR
ncbi:MAG: hypothetical protein V8R95_12300 [Faecalibacterium sp.]